jgi:penicillin-binding protein 1A
MLVPCMPTKRHCQGSDKMTESTQNKRVNRKRGKSSDKRRKKRSIWKKVFAIIGIIGAMAVMAVMIYLVTIIGTLEDLDPDSLVNYEQTSMVFDNQDNLISSIHGVENRIYVPLNQIPEHVQNAFHCSRGCSFSYTSGF